MHKARIWTKYESAQSRIAALPGFNMRGEYDHSAWAYGDLVPAARQAMANYLTEFRIRPHRRFQVTTDHIAAGTAPPPPGP